MCLMGKEIRTEYNQVLSNRGVEDPHSTHCAACVVEDPFFVEVHVGGELGVQVVNDVFHDGGGVVAVFPQGI